MERLIKVKIPATSANLGAGFDALGLALTLYNYVYLSPSDRTCITSLDHTHIPQDESNLVFTSAKAVYQACGRKMDGGLRIRQTNHIPMTRGLGSSSACIAAGLIGANALLNFPMSTDDLINLAASIEGHPDNIAPALLGGIVTSVYDGAKVYYVKQDVGAHLYFYAIIPDFCVKTDVARKVLPSSVAHHDAVFNLSRAALFSASLLQGKYTNLKVAAQDKLHQPYRMSMIPGGEEVLQECYRLNAYAAYVSGAGPSIIAVCDQANYFFSMNMREKLNSMGKDGWQILQLSIDNYGAQAYESDKA